ncbi:hypothetical protein JY651_09520 [Pyxidicoccus parkwayensis]|uniref:Lipoprotein n=1 Tax=Pyxidicoccus parkwayensis TaxID=2813578 RepID=A0ABX7P3U8_9BACT|nr:hypothetical protein [Pyxidicoccus parkwaysis]QSQ25145.1 hypothetical protein JY651_09520 [Pyxidicoccus parkwaysis]
MSDIRTSRNAAKYLRLPLLMGLFTLGNLGCGGEEWDTTPACQHDCSVEGTWDVRYAYPSALPSECLEEGVVLPTGPLKITRIEGTLLATIGDLALGGLYLDRDKFSSLYGLPLSLSGSQNANPGSPRYRFSYSGSLSLPPETPDTPLTWKGTLHVSPFDGAEGRCNTVLDFTAFR